MVIFFKEDYFTTTIIYLQSSFRYDNIYRPNINIQFIRNPLNYFYIQYLAIFPTPLELINKPYKIIIILDSFMIFITFSRAWKSLINLINPYKHQRQTIAILFIFITIVYFSLFGIIGSFNLGSSQRLRTNWIPIGIIFPLLLEKTIRDQNNIQRILFIKKLIKNLFVYFKLRIFKETCFISDNYITFIIFRLKRIKY